MSDNKNLVTVVVSVSIAVLIMVCLGLFWLTWSALSEAERVKEENHQLLLGNTVCQLRLENLQNTSRTPQPESPLNDIPVSAVPAAATAASQAEPPASTIKEADASTVDSATSPALSPATPSAALPADSAAPTPIRRPWFVQLAAYKRSLPAEDFVREAQDMLDDAGFKLKVFSVKKGSYWLVCVDEPLSKNAAQDLARKIARQADLESVVTRLPLQPSK